MADSLKEILDIARQALPDVPDAVWARIEGRIRLNFGGQRPYIASQKKRRHLEALAEADASADAARMAAQLGLSVRHLRRLKSLKR